MENWFRFLMWSNHRKRLATSYTGCRHEPPVMDWDVSVLQEEEDVVTVYKPPTVPVHPCGQYRKNTVVGILQAEHGLAPLFPVHRLDRLVSGLLILARNASKADLFRQEIEAGLVQKHYVAKVIGVFPEDEKVVDVNINYNAREGRSTVEVGDSCGGKPACTRFSRISTNRIHSIVLCKPITGRTHQIRVHLQYTGHPIANDSLYLSEHVTDCSAEGMGADRAACSSRSCAKYENGHSSKSEGNCKEDFTIDPMCTNCPNLAPKGYDGLEEGLWLHCVQYSGPGWIYDCPYPDWASLA
uniref:RNA pseudouridine synthase 7 n=2 Tax=Rhizophora mucronata TaxID=61149 RepID=A0A2P2KY15_RHIMU